MASRNASRTVMFTVSVPSGTSGCTGSAIAGSGAWAGGGSGARAACGSSFCACAGGADSAAFCGRAGCRAPLMAEASSPSDRISAIGVLTATSAVPAGTKILPSVPSSTASTSIVALSVSISAITSPALTFSPSFFTHLARLPFSIVGESAGIRTSIGTLYLRSAQHVGRQLGSVGLRIVGREFRRFVDEVAHFGVDFFQLVLALDFLGEDARAHLLDRIVLGAHFLHFVARAVLRRVRHRMAAVAVGHHLEDVGTLAAAREGHRAVARGLDRAHVHAVDLLAGNVEGGAALGKIRLRGRTLDRGAHGVFVVLDHVDDGQLPKLRHVEALVDLALIGGAVAEISAAHAPVLSVAVGEGDAGSDRALRADDAVAAVEVLLDREHVHRAALALGIAAAAAGELGHHALRVHAAGEHVAVVAVAGDDLIPLLDRHLHADHDRFLADVEMAKAADQPHAVKLARLFLETADPEHLLIGVELVIARPGGGRVGAARFRLVCGFGGNGHGVLGAILASLGLA